MTSEAAFVQKVRVARKTQSRPLSAAQPLPETGRWFMLANLPLRRARPPIGNDFVEDYSADLS